MQESKINTAFGSVSRGTYQAQARSRVAGKRRVDVGSVAPLSYGVYADDEGAGALPEVSPAKRSRMAIEGEQRV